MSATNINGAIAEQPRKVDKYPLLDAVYQRHDNLIAEHTSGRVLEVAHGQYAHPDADVAVDIHRENAKSAPCETAIADARSLPFADDAFDTIIGRRFLHHVPNPVALMEELHRVLVPGGKCLIIEGTPGVFRRVVKGAAFRVGLLGTDTDEYGHLSSETLDECLKTADFQIGKEKQLGSPLMPLAIVRSPRIHSVASAINRTQWVKWWTLVVATATASSRPKVSTAR